MKKLSIIFSVLAILLSDIMCAVVAYNYCALEWSGKYEGWSAPASTALFLAIPYIIGTDITKQDAFIKELSEMARCLIRVFIDSDFENFHTYMDYVSDEQKAFEAYKQMEEEFQGHDGE